MTRTGIAIAVAAALLAATVGEARAQDPGAEETNVRYPPSSARWMVIVAGSAVFAVSYGGAAAMAGAWSDVPGRDMLFIPVAGPWIALGQSGCAPDEESSRGEGDCEAWLAVRGILYTIDGLLQLGGVGIVGEGIFMTTESDAPADKPAEKKASIAPAPIVTKDSIGFGLVGTF